MLDDFLKLNSSYYAEAYNLTMGLLIHDYIYNAWFSERYD